MDTLLAEILPRLGIGGVYALAFYFLLKELLKTKLESIRREQENKMTILEEKTKGLEASLAKHISRHRENEQSLCSKIDKLYEIINPMRETLYKIQGYMEAKNDKGK
jgi:septal ring factor EnvC (AmiA/AmiB activator)